MTKSKDQPVVEVTRAKGGFLVRPAGTKRWSKPFDSFEKALASLDGKIAVPRTIMFV